jgi:putative membrane protein
MAYRSSNSDSEYAIWISLGTTLLLILASFISPVLRYLYLKFHIENDELIINSGVFNKERKAIPLERIQNINIDQNLVQRFLNIVSLEVETAGSKAKELTIPGLERSVADALKKELNKRGRAIKLESTESLTENSEPIEQGVVPKTEIEEQGEVIMDLNLIDLFKVGITQNHLRSGFAALGLMFGFYYQFQDPIEELFGDYLEAFTWENAVASATFSLATFTIIGFLIASVIVSLVLAINRYYGFKMVHKEDYLEVSMGLLNRKEIKLPLQKIQVLEFHSNPLRRLLGFKTAAIHQAQSTDSGAAGVSIPACRKEQQRQIHEIVFGAEPSEPTQVFQAHAWSHARLRFYIVGTFAIPAAATLVYFEQYVPLVFLGAVVIINVFFAYMYGKKSWVGRNAEFVSFAKGWIFPSEIITPIFKTQAVERWRSVFLKRREECHIKIHTASGPRGLRYLNENDMIDFYNGVNNQVLVEERKWM